MAAQALSIFVPIKKIDEEQRLVYGTVAAEVMDNSGEMFDYEGSKPYFEKWSANAEITSGGKSKGNLRVMHTSKVAGVLTDLGFNDNDKIIECCAKVVDDAEWQMVQAGGYTGFSMGGRYVSRATKSDGVKTYIADPVEVSLVDKPCIPTATFEVIKADGIVEQREFHPELVEKAEQARHPAGSSKGGQFASSKGGGGGAAGAVAEGHGAGGSGSDSTGHGDASAQATVTSKPAATADNWQSTAEISGFIGDDRSVDKQVELDTRSSERSAKSYVKSYGKEGDTTSSIMRRHAEYNRRLAADRLEVANNWAKTGHYETARSVFGSHKFELRLAEAKEARATAIETRAAKIGKADIGEEEMAYVPTNDEMFPVARELAKAAGVGEEKWLDYMEAACSQIIAEKADGLHDVENCSKADCPDCAAAKADGPPKEVKDKIDAKKDGEEGDDEDGDKADKEGDDKEKKPPFEKADTSATDSDPGTTGAANPAQAKGDLEEADTEDAKAKAAARGAKDEAAQKSDEPELEQGWKAKDGTFFLKKADAIAHNETLAKADGAEPSLADQLRKAAETAAKIGTEDADAEEEGEEKPATKADVIAAVSVPLERFKAFLGTEGLLAKGGVGMYNVRSLADIVSNLEYLHSTLCCEQAWDGDNSALPTQVFEGLVKLGGTLVQMAEEAVTNLVDRATRRKSPDIVTAAPAEIMGLAASTLGLEKAAFEDRLAKFAEANPIGEGDVLQKRDGSADDDVLAKVDTLTAENTALKAEMAEITPLVKGLMLEIERIKALPMPKAPTTRVVGKGDEGDLQKVDAGGSGGDLLSKFTPAQLSDAAIRMAHQHGRHFVMPVGQQGGGQ